MRRALVYRGVHSSGILPNALIQAWWNSLSVKPSDGLTADLNTLSTSLNSIGRWSEYDFLNIIAGMETTEQSLRPIVTTSGLDVTAINSPTINVNGLTGNGTSSYVNLNWTPSLHGVKYTQNNCAAGCYVSTTSGTANRRYFGAFKNTATISSCTIIAGASVTCQCNSSAATNPIISRAAGMVFMFRTASNAVNIRINNTLGTQQTTASTGLTPFSVFGAALNLNGSVQANTYSNDTIRDFQFGSSVLASDGQIRTIFNTFYAARGLSTF